MAKKNNLPPFKALPPKKGKGATTPAPTPQMAAGIKPKTPLMGKLVPPGKGASKGKLCGTCKKSPCAC